MADWPLFPPKPGLTKDELRKVKAWIRKYGVTPCPPVGSPELAALEIKKYQEWLGDLAHSTKVKLGYIPTTLDGMTPAEKRERKRQQEKAWHRKQKERKQDNALEP